MKKSKLKREKELQRRNVKIQLFNLMTEPGFGSDSLKIVISQGIKEYGTGTYQ